MVSMAGLVFSQCFHTESSLGGKLVACQEADGAAGSQQALCYDSYQHQIGFVQSSGCPGSTRSHNASWGQLGLRARRGCLEVKL